MGVEVIVGVKTNIYSSPASACPVYPINVWQREREGDRGERALLEGDKTHQKVEQASLNN